MIIIEGPDNAGKSTLAAILSKTFNLPIHHAGGPPKNYDEIMERSNYILNNSSGFIFDRVPFISEPVYSILRNYNLFADEFEVYNRLKKLKPIIIYCRPPDNIILDLTTHGVKDWDDLDHLLGVSNNIKKLVDRYDEVMNSSYLPPCRLYDYTSDGIDNLIEWVKHEILRLGHYQSKEPSKDDRAEQFSKGL